MSRTLIAVLALVAVVVAAGLLLLAGGAGPGGTPAPSATLPPVAPATTVSADARVVPIRFAELAAPGAGGVVAEVLVEVGDRIAAGAGLLRLDGTVAQAEVAQAEAGVAAARAQAGRAAAIAEQAADQVLAAAAAVDEAEAAVAAADARRDALPEAASDDEERAADADVARASAALRAARAQLNAARDARAAASEAATAATAEVGRAEAALSTARAVLDELTLTAPLAGVVAYLDAAVGETIAPGEPVARIADDSGWRFRTTDLDETAVGRIGIGATATVTLDALPDRAIPARVVAIAPFGELVAGDVVYEVELEPAGAVPDGLRWNMTASVTIDTAAGG